MMIASLVVVFCLVFFVAEIVATRYTITAHYPRSLTSLSLRGDGCGLNWNSGIRMTNTAQVNGHYQWQVEIDCDASVKNVELKVLVNDNTWMLGSNHHISFDKKPVVDVYPWFYTYQGSLQTIPKVYSPELKNTRDVIVYLPPSYQENTVKRHRNVLIMHDGQNLFDPRTSAFGTAWMCQNTLDNMIITGQSDELLIVGPYNTNDRTNEYTYIYDPSESTGGKGDLYLNWLESTLIPLTKESFRVDIQRETLGILGSSLGGLISCYAGWTRANVYGKVGCMSSSFWWDDNNYQKDVIINQAINTTMYSVPTFYMDSGTAGGDGSCAVYTNQVYDYYLEHGFVADQTVYKYVDQGGEHNEASWGKRFHLPMAALYPPSTV